VQGFPLGAKRFTLGLTEKKPHKQEPFDRPMLARTLLFVLALLFSLATPLTANAQIPGLSLPSSGNASSEEAPQATEPGATLQLLINVLRDDTAREALITELEQGLAATGEAPAAEEAQPESLLTPLELRSVGGQIADFTQWIAESGARSLIGVWNQIVAAPAIFSALSMDDVDVVVSIVVDLLSLILITYGGFFAMRALTERFRDKLRLTVRNEGWFARIVAVTLAFVVDIVSAIVPWALGYVVALSILGIPGDISFAHSLYLNAFVLIEVSMALLRVVLAPQKPEARLVHLKDAYARAVMRWSRIFISLFVFGQFLVLPLFNRTVSLGAGRAISILGLLLVLGLAVVAVMRAHGAVSKMLVRWIPGTRSKRLLRTLIRYWHVPVLFYLGILALIAISRPLDGFYTVLLANGQIAIAILAGMIAANILTKMIGKGIHLPQGISQRVPLLELRLNSFVPRVLWVLRIFVVAAVIIFCLHALGLFNFMAFLESQFGARLAGAIVTVTIILLVTFVLWLVLNSWVDYRIHPDYGMSVSSRERTLLVLLRNAATIALIVITLMFVLSEIGINIAPLLASAGVIGLAVGFGAQKLVQDIITGIFIQLEGAIDVGDVVSIGGISGVVERLTIRSASLRDVEGSYHIIPFSSVDTVTNFMRGFSFALIDMGVAYREEEAEVKQAMFDAFNELKQDKEMAAGIIGDFEWMGVNSFGASEVVFRGRIKTLPGKQWGIKRAYNAIVKRIFDARDIEIPFPHQTVYFGADKRGKAPPVHVTSDANPLVEAQQKAQSDSSDTAIANTEPAAKPAPKRPRRKKAKPDVEQLPDVDAGPDVEEDR
jgi:moderate conductance mechanosensitive channel